MKVYYHHYCCIECIFSSMWLVDSCKSIIHSDGFSEIGLVVAVFEMEGLHISRRVLEEIN